MIEMKNLKNLKNLNNITRSENGENRNSWFVRVGFYKIQKGRYTLIHIIIGNKLCESIGISSKDTMEILGNEICGRIIFVKKHNENKDGFRIVKHSIGHKSTSFTWNMFEPHPEELYLKIVPHEIIEQDGEKLLKLDLAFDPKTQGKKKRDAISISHESPL